MISIKKGAKIRGIRAEIVLASLVIHGVLDKLTITEVTGGKHIRGSLHFIGNAIDIRTRHISKEQHLSIYKEIRKRLNNEFDVILKKTHIHVEFQPKM